MLAKEKDLLHWIEDGMEEDSGRNDALFRGACWMQSRGFEDNAIIEAIKAKNSAFDAPLDNHELRLLIRQALKYKKGASQIVRRLYALIVAGKIPRVRDSELTGFEELAELEKVDPFARNILERVAAGHHGVIYFSEELRKIRLPYPSETNFLKDLSDSPNNASLIDAAYRFHKLELEISADEAVGDDDDDDEQLDLTLLRR